MMSASCKPGKKLFAMFFLVFVLQLAFVNGDLQGENENFISGARKISVKSSPVIYNTFIPLIYEFNLPKWNIHTMKIQYWKEHNNCSETDQYEDGYPCPVMYHMNHIIESLAKNYSIWENLLPLADSDNLSNETAIDIPEKIKLCSEIVSHFKTFQSTTSALENYLNVLKECPLADLAIEMYKKNYVYDLEELYHQAFTAFPEAYYARVAEPINKGLTLNSWTSLQTTLLLNHYVETNRWTNALASCRAKAIPYSLIDHPAFEKVMKEIIIPKIEKKGYKLSVPLSQLASYFKLPLTDCVFASKNFLFVRVLIPVYNEKRDYSVVKFESMPFWKRTVDNKNQGEICGIKGIDRKASYIQDKNSEFIEQTNCKDNELCHIADSTNIPFNSVHPCVSAVSKNVKKDILSKCSLSCQPFSTDDESLPMISPSSQNEFFIAGKTRVEKVTVTCSSQIIQVIPNLEFGAWNLNLPCGCQIVKNATVFQSDNATCKNVSQDGGQLNILHVKPYHWEGLTNEQISFSGEISSSLRSSNSKAGAGAGATYEANDERLFQRNTMDDKAEALPVASMADVNELIHEKYSSILTQQIFLWVVILFLVIVMAVLSYFVYHLKEWKQNEVHRRNRLVYNVGDATDMTEHF